MKKIFLSIALIASGYIATAQLEVGVTAAYGTTWLLNKSLSDSPDIDYVPSFAGTFGLQGTMFINHKVGFGIELNAAKVIQKYESQDNNDYTAKEKINIFEIPVLLKLKSDGGFYFELGPKFSFTGKATEDLKAPGIDFTDQDISKGINKTVISGIIGFGGRFALSDLFDLAVGLRLAANFNDINKEFSSFSELNSNDVGVSCYYGNVDKHGDLNYVKTYMLTGHLQAGFIMKIGGDKK